MKKIRKGLAITMLTLAASATLFYAAACGDKTVEFTFSTQYSSHANEQVKEGETYELPVLEAEGYSFEGWYLSSDYSGEPITSVVATQNVTYYAKWEKMYMVTLDLKGGTFSGETSFYLKPGASVYDAVKNIVPQKGELQFGGWFRGTGEVGETLMMPKSNVALTAKYKARYTIELYAQTLNDPTVYEQIDTIPGYAYVGSEYEADVTREGYTITYTSETVDTIESISATATENVMKLYYKRNDVTVSFHANYPAGYGTSPVNREKVKYGQPVEIPSDYVLEGYCLIGWSTSKSGKAEYPAYYLDNVLYGGTDKENEQIEFKKDTTLYAVWAKGYKDMFGGNDYIFRLTDDATKIYLARGGVFYEGACRTNGTFIIKNTNTNKTLLEGKLMPTTHSFLYFDRMNSEKAYYLYRAGEGVLDNVKIEWGRENDLTYYNEAGKVLKGTYTPNQDNGYVVTLLVDGETGATETMTIVLGYAPTSDGSTVSVFQIRNEEESKIQGAVRLAIYNGQPNTFYPMLSLDGFGNATLTSTTGVSQYYYKKEADTVTLINKASGSIYGYLRIQTLTDGQNVDYLYTYYEPNLDQKFDLGDSEKLTLDGIYTATYFDGTEELKGVYETTPSALGGLIITMYTSVQGQAVTYTFYVSATTVEVPDTTPGAQEGATITKTEYSVSKKTNAYKEYLHKDAQYIYYSPLIIVDSVAVDGKTEAILYDCTLDKTYVPAIHGYYTYNESTKVYTFIAEEIDDAYDAENSMSPYLLSEIKSFVFALDTYGSYEVHYWYSMTQGENEVQNFATEYTAANGDKLTFVAGVAVFAKVDGENVSVKTGTYVEKDGYTVVTFTDQFGQKTYAYVVVDKDDASFEQLVYEPYTSYLRKADGTTDNDTYIIFDGKTEDKATYVANGTQTEITISEVGTTVNKTVYSFTVGSTTYKFIQFTKTKFSIYDATYATNTYYSDFGTLKFDGYGYRAEYYEDEEGTSVSEYTVVSTNVIRITLDGVRYVDLKVEGGSYTFTIRGEEYGKADFVDNQVLTGAYIQFNGYNEFTYYADDDATGKSGTYVRNGDVITLTFADQTVWTVEYSAANSAVVLSYKNVVNVYVNETDWSVLMLDEFGNATKYTANGQREYGYYTLISENLLYYINRDSSFACIYEYDINQETATPIQPDEISYYNANFESLYFTEYGFAIFNGETQYFFNEEDDGTVYIYRLAKAGETPDTAYGYMKIEFGSFDQEEIKWGENNETYYVNEGSRIDFVRAAEDAKNYPLKTNQGVMYALSEITFRPTGASEFTVACSVTIAQEDGSTAQLQDARLTRKILEDGSVETYITYQYYRWDVTLDFSGMDSEDNAYTVTRMRYMQEIPAYQYLEEYYNLYVKQGAAAANKHKNEFGTLLYCTEFQTSGEPTTEGPYMMGSFGKNSNLYDDNGNLVSFEKGTATFAENGMNQVVFESKKEDGGDGNLYCLYFVLGQHQAFSVPAYKVYAFTRVQQFTPDDTYTLSVGRVISSDFDYIKKGSIFSVQLEKKDGELVPENGKVELLTLASDTKFYYIVRTVDETTKKITASTYYEVTLTLEGNGTVEGDDSVGLYKDEFTVNVITTIQTVYDANGKSYVDVNTETNAIMSVNVEGRAYAVKSFSIADGKYTVNTTTGYVFEITITDNVATIVDVTEQTNQE